MQTAKRRDFHTEPFPTKHVTLPLDLHYSESEMEKIKQGLIPQQMEEKWFIFYEDGILHFYRSWTGYCIYRAYFEKENDYILTHADVNRNKEQYKETNDVHDQAMISYLINILLLHRDAAFPVAHNIPEHNTLAEWSQVGKAMFALNSKCEVRESDERVQGQNDDPQEFVRIIPIQRFTGLPAPPQIPYTFYADASYLYGSSVAGCYALVVECHDIVDRFLCQDIVDTRLFSVACS